MILKLNLFTLAYFSTFFNGRLNNVVDSRSLFRNPPFTLKSFETTSLFFFNFLLCLLKVLFASPDAWYCPAITFFLILNLLILILYRISSILYAVLKRVKPLYHSSAIFLLKFEHGLLNLWWNWCLFTCYDILEACRGSCHPDFIA